MSSVSPSSVVTEFISEVIEAINDADLTENVLYGLQVRDTMFDKIDTDRGLVVSASEFDLSPRQENDIAFWDALVIIGIWSRIDKKDKVADRSSYRDDCYRIGEAIAAAIIADCSLGSRVCDAQMQRAVDGWRNIQSDHYAILNLPLILNPTGESVDFNLGEPQ